MKSHLWKVAATASLSVLVLAGCGTGAGSGGSGTTPAASAPGTSSGLGTAQSTLGTIIVNGQGKTAYVFDKDKAGAGTSACTGPCATLWPAITSTTATPTVTGVTGTVGTISLPNGTKQVTVDGLPLYTYAPDAAAGDVTGQGYGGIWWVVAPTGKKITAAPAPASSAPASSGSYGQGY
ncbi:hypothetical protein AL755_11680 [Arthrobacter sp. ERGS1:01]|uniref:COG4315 family predicted lipoprotein n=1 Tax=Arthrobacter sp. ERGS1:01 TaxID=1704044 RepID=UPI0006B61B3E|nr:hypothetical protein [Arthrobacter sp. ERGS1:01]ALE05976.1 hypothetical protein AL755_11680 [Arthrobacter sp. ERGS1:01]